MIIADLSQRLRWKSTVRNEFLGVSEWNDIIGSTMKDQRTRFQRGDGAPILPSRAEQHKRGVTRIDVQGNRTTTGRTHNHIRSMLIVLKLSRPNRSLEIVIVKCGIDDFVSGVFEVSRFDATRNRMPAVKEENFQLAFLT